jgi:hypothetical protein
MSEFVKEHDSEFFRFEAIASQGGSDPAELLERDNLREVKRLRHLYQAHWDWERQKERDIQGLRMGTAKSVLHKYYPQEKQSGDNEHRSGEGLDKASGTGNV